MYVRKVRGQEQVGRIILTRTEVEVVQKRGLKVEHYVKEMLFIIAKKRRWTWYLKRVNKGNPTGVIYE
jgi:hypothetical protein